MKTNSLIRIFTAVALICICAAPVMAAGTTTLDFENGTNWEQVVAGGLTFGTLNKNISNSYFNNLYYADREYANWRINPQYGKTGEYYVGGNVGVISPFDNVAVITFEDAVANFSVDYSSYFGFVAEAYNAAGDNIGRASGVANYGTGLKHIDLIPTENISSIRLWADMGTANTSTGYWMIDNVSYTSPAAVPEASTVMAALSILAPAGMLFRRPRKS